jgi:hypothetical protein
MIITGEKSWATSGSVEPVEMTSRISNMIIFKKLREIVDKKIRWLATLI